MFDFILSAMLLPIFLLPIIVLILFATIDTGQFGLFFQTRIGQHGNAFKMMKIRTLKNKNHQLGHFHLSATKFGLFLRRSKLDELPQLIHVFFGQMSFVGPRPDLKGFADELLGSNRIILMLKPGLTGPATLKYKNEDDLLALQNDAETYNKTIIWPDKVKINVNYALNWSFKDDVKYILKSLIN
ncbi:MAG: sugar transferase [bacterium]